MKALISPNEMNEVVYVSSWEIDENKNICPIYTQITGTMRIAEVRPNEEVFEVAQPLYWIDCPDSCDANDHYFKDGEFFRIPKEPKIPLDI
jgi:hypothetical protein